MLTLAQAFIARPKLLMIDELTLGLAPVIVERLLDIVRAIHANGTTIVLVEQSVNIAITLAQRAVFMEKGEVRFDGPTAELLDRPDILRAVFLRGAAAAGNGSQAAVREAKERHPFVEHCEACGREHKVVLETSGLSVSTNTNFDNTSFKKTRTESHFTLRQPIFSGFKEFSSMSGFSAAYGCIGVNGCQTWSRSHCSSCWRVGVMEAVYLVILLC